MNMNLVMELVLIWEGHEAMKLLVLLVVVLVLMTEEVRNSALIESAEHWGLLRTMCLNT